MTLKKTYAILLALLVAIAIFPPFFIEAIELKAYDLFMRHQAPGVPDDRIVIISIDQKSLDTFGRWPWPRDIIGTLIEKMSGFGAGIVALDMTFSTEADKKLNKVVAAIDESLKKEKINRSHPKLYNKISSIKESIDKDKILAKAIEKAGNVVTAFLFHGPDEAEYSEKVYKTKLRFIRPFRIKLTQRSADSKDAHIWFAVSGVEPNINIVQKAGAASGFLNILPDEDGVIRSLPMVIEYKKGFYPSLPLAIAILHKKAQFKTKVIFDGGMVTGVMVGADFLPTDEHGFFMPKYMGPDGTFPEISIADIINAPLTDETMKRRLNGKIALVGATATQLYDLRVSPLGFMPGVGLHTNAIAAMLNGNVVSKFGWQKIYDVIMVIALGAILFFVLNHMRAFLGLAFTTALFIGLIVFNFVMFSKYSLWLNTVTPGITIALCFTTVSLYQFVEERRSRRFIKNAFGQYLSPKIINQLIQDPDILNLGGEEKVITAFFSDIAGFTSISERVTPTELVSLLNEYLSEMTDIIHEHEGTLDKFEGDAIVAFWGAPVDQEDHAELAVRTAVAQQKRLVELREKWRSEGKDEITIRIGINTGLMKVGNMGSKARLDYTIMGDAANTASRLEGASKHYGTKIIVSEFTREELKGKYLLRELDKVRVAGKKDALRIFDVIDVMNDTTEKQRNTVKLFEEGVTAFRNLDLDHAEKMFKQCAGFFDNESCNVYLRRIARRREMPPDMEWDAVYDLAK